MNFCHYAKFFSFLFFKWRCFNKNCFLSWKCFRKKKIKKFIQRCYKERSYYNPWQNYFREKKKCSPTCKAHLSAVTQESWNQLDGECFFSWMKPSVDVMGELWGSIHEGQLNSTDIFQQCLIWIMLDLLQLKLIIQLTAAHCFCNNCSN